MKKVKKVLIATIDILKHTTNVHAPHIPAKAKVPLWLIAALTVGLIIGGLLSRSPARSDADHRHPGTGSSHESSGTPNTVWTCSMHPQVRQSEPGLCPLCAMDLIPLTDTGDEPTPQIVVLSQRSRTLAQIGTTRVHRQHMNTGSLRLLGRIEPDETTIKNITAWTSGRIDRLHVKATGQKVRRGQTIATLYSPEVFSAHQDLLVAKKHFDGMNTDNRAAKTAANRALQASRTRLRLLGVPENKIARLEQDQRPTTKVAIRTPFTGTVTERMATEGAYVQTGALLYKVVDLSRVWVQLEAYESDLPALALEQDVIINVDGLPNETFEGQITFIDPTLDPAKRVAKIRVEVVNKEGRLRPGMFAAAAVKSPLPEGALPPLVIPETAPLFTGRRAIVFVEDPTAQRPTYTARTVRLGVKAANEYPVIAGLSEGEQVVTKGAFTLDADLQIRGGHSMMTAPDDLQQPHLQTILPVTAEERKKLSPTLNAYLEMQKQLAADDFDQARAAAKTLKIVTLATSLKGATAVIEFWGTHRKQIISQADAFTNASSIEQGRGIFETLSNQMIVLLKRLGNPLESQLKLTFCPMAFGSKGAHWIQPGAVVDNPYYGHAMRTCGEIQRHIDGGTHLLIETPPPTSQPAIAGGHHH